jgi:thiol-disulfide isomerase/thioredoxin
MKAEYILATILVVLVGGGLLALSYTPSSAPTTSFTTENEIDPETGTTLNEQDPTTDAGVLNATETGVETATSQKVPKRKQAGTPYIDIVSPEGFVNTDGITLKELVGKKIILVDFLTYSCINCQRTFPYMNAWYEKYKDQGLEIVGIHTPEFAFEKDIDNVRTAMQKFGITYPIVLDNKYSTWNAYKNRYWPRKYLIDIYGNVVYDHIGEGAYEETEMKIKELLDERAEVLKESVQSSDSLAVTGVPKVSVYANSPETYFGSERNEFLANGTAHKSGEQMFTFPTIFIRNLLYLSGTWDIQGEYSKAVTNSVLKYRYSAQEVYIVAESDTPVEMEIWQDGKLVTTEAGTDVVNGIVTVSTSKLYKLIKNTTSSEHTLEIKVRGSGVKLYAFTFG